MVLDKEKAANEVKEDLIFFNDIFFVINKKRIPILFFYDINRFSWSFICEF